MIKACFLALVVGVAQLANAADARSEFDLGAIRSIAPGAPIPMPKEVFPPAYREQLLRDKNEEAIARADEYLKTPADVWRERIPLRVGVGWYLLHGATDVWNFTCPACQRPLRFGKVDVYAGTVIAACCGAVCHEDPDRWPEDAPGRPNKVMKIPHLDGTTVDYHYYEFAERFPRDQSWQPWSPADGSKKREIFIPGGYILIKRLHELVNRVIPHLGWAYFHTGEAKYARLLAAMLDRLADVYPGWPLWIPYSGRYGFALNRAGNGVLTREEYDAAVRPMRWGTQFWSAWERSYGFGHTKMGSPTHQYEMGKTAYLVKAYAAIRGSAAARSYSAETHGDPDRFDRRVMQNVFGEKARLLKCYEPWTGNYTQAWFEGGTLLSLLTQDRWFYDCVNELMERSLYDECYADHATTQGSCSYWGMVLTPLIRSFELRERLYDPEVKKRHPRLLYFPHPAALQETLSSWRWVIPAFGDTWNPLYPNGARKETKAPADYASTHFTHYGVSMMRWGAAEGRRQEACLVYQRVAGHTHSDCLNLELFIDGLPVFWDMGYGNGTVDTCTERHPEIRELIEAGYPRPVFDTGPYFKEGKGHIPSGHWWTNEWNQLGPAHCTVMVDERPPVKAWHDAAPGIPVTIMSAGPARAETGSAEQAPPPASAAGDRLLEVLDVAQRGGFAGGASEVSQYRRTLLTVRTPSGGGYLVDVFRVTGGSKHEFYYHAIAEKATSDLPEGQALPGALASYRECTLALPEKMKELQDPKSLQTTGWSRGYRHIGDLKRIDDEPPHWRLEWEYDPMLYAPKTQGGRARVAHLLDAQMPVALSVHGARQPGTEREAWLWRSRGLLTGHLHEQLKDGSWLQGWNGNVGFVGGLDMIIEERRGDDGLRSTFVHVLEGRRADLPSEVATVRNLACDNPPQGAVALEIKLTSGETDRVFCLAESGEAKGDGFRFVGRYGLVRTDASGAVRRACLIRGVSIRSGEFELAAKPEHVCTALRFEGDLAGNRAEPAILVKSNQALPVGRILAGNPLNVISPDGWAEVYFIESVKSAGNDEWRVALRGHPTFILDFLTVGAPHEDDPQAFFPLEKDLTKASLGSLYEENVSLVRLSDGKSFAVDVRFIRTPDWRQRVVLREGQPPFAESGLTRGDKCILLRHRAGDKVVIPLRKSHP